jgi:hypothetical protein
LAMEVTASVLDMNRLSSSSFFGRCAGEGGDGLVGRGGRGDGVVLNAPPGSALVLGLGPSRCLMGPSRGHLV